MSTRREFLRFLAIAAAAGAFTLDAHARGSEPKRPAAKSVVYTKRVRAVTEKLKVPRGRWKMIVAHHSAIRNGNARSYDREHRRRGMENGLAYHFVIGNGVDSGDGQIEIGSRWVRQIKGGHVRMDEINEVAIGICLVGNFQETNPTKKQLAAFHELMTYLRDHVVGDVRFAVHKEVDPGRTVCPGRRFPTKQMHRLYG
jgi:hypothetical protein